MDIPESANVDMMEISIPPTSITHSIPSAITIVTALFFNMSISDLGFKKEGLMAVTIAKSKIRITARRNSLEPVIFFRVDFYFMIFPPPLMSVLFPLQAQGFFPELPHLYLIHLSSDHCTSQRYGQTFPGSPAFLKKSAQ